MDLIIEILGFAALAHLVVDFLQSFDIPILHRKPLSCDMCMGFWLSVPHYWIHFGFMHGLAMAALTGIVADLIFRWKQRL